MINNIIIDWYLIIELELKYLYIFNLNLNDIVPEWFITHIQTNPYKQNGCHAKLSQI